MVSTGYPAEKVFVIPNSCDIELFSASEQEVKKLRSDHPWLGHSPLILYAGTLGQINGVSYFARLAAEVKKLNPDVRFLAIGDGREWDPVENTARELGVLNENFFMMKRIPKEQIPAWYSCAAMGSSFVIDLKELWNNSANKFFDTLAAGKPILINHKGWQAELIEKTGAGISLDPQNIQEAAKQLCYSLGDVKWLENASNAAKELAKEFDREKLAKKLETVLMEACT